MSRKLFGKGLAKSFGILTMLAVTLVGCTSNNPMGVAETPFEKPGHTLHAAQWIGPSGGVLSVGPYTLTVPPGAVGHMHYFEIQQVQAGQWDVDMSPHGLQFMIPVQLTFDASGEVDPSRLNVYWENPQSGQDELQETMHLGSNVAGVLHHFSRYKLL